MQPENNTQKNAEEGMDAALKSTEASTQEGAAVQEVPNEQSNSEKTKMSKKQIIGLAVLSLIAVGGVLFGIYGMNSQSEHIAELTTKMERAEKKVKELNEFDSSNYDVEMVEDEIVEDEESITNDNNNSNNYDMGDFELGRHLDYIYVPEWGLKIRVPDNLIILDYKYSIGGTYGDYIYVTGVKGQTGVMVPRVPFQSEGSSNGGLLRATTEDGTYLYGPLVYTDGNGNNYYWSGPNAYPARTDGDALELWLESKDMVRDMFSAPENYSAI